MPITYRIDPEEGIVRTVVSGVVVDADLRGHEDQLAADPHFEPGMGQVIDGRFVEALNVSAEAVRNFVAYERSRYSARFAGHRVAIVASSDVVFGMARMYQTLSGVEVGVFRSMPEALTFLGKWTVDV